MRLASFFESLQTVGRQQGTFSALLFGAVERGLSRPLFPYQFTFPPAFWSFQEGRGRIIFDESAYFRTTEETYATFQERALKEREAAVVREIETCTLKVTPPEQAIPRLAQLYGKLLAATIYAEALHEPFAKKQYAGDDFLTFFTLATLPTSETYLDRRLAAALSGDEQRLRRLMTGYYLAPKLAGLRDKVLAEHGGRAKAILQEKRQEYVRNKRRQAAYEKTLSAGDARLFAYLRLGAAVRDRRKEWFGALGVSLTDAAEALLAAHDIPQSLAPFCHYADFDEGVPPDYGQLLAQRRRGFSYISDHEHDTRTFFDAYDPPGLQGLNKPTTRRLRGLVGYRGVAEGPARIIISETDFRKFKTGDVLVTSMTRPEFVPLLQRAAAIITDEGGLTSHAVIIARELQKPCIIGTRTATETLHDGELVRVDADKGEIIPCGGGEDENSGL